MFFKNRSSRIILLGLNELSINLARRLSRDNDLIILDENTDDKLELVDADIMIEEMEEGLITTLKRCQVDSASFLLAVSENDEYNLFTASLVKNMGVRRSAALVQKMEYTAINSEVDLIFNPYQIIFDKISTMIKETRLQAIKNLVPGKVDLSQIIVRNEDAFSYVKIKNLAIDGCIITAINRNDRILLPEPDLQIYPGDTLYILYRRGMIDQLLKLFKRKKVKKRLYIFGGNEFCLTLARLWKNLFQSVVVIEPDIERCNLLAEKLENTLILNGDGTDLSLLKEEGLDQNGVFLAANENDLNNILSSFAAVETGCFRIITLLNETRYREIAGLMKLSDLIVIPDLVAEQLTDLIRAGLKLNRSILGGDIFITQVKLQENNLFKDKKLAEVNLPRGLIIGVIIREKEVIIPDGESMLRANDCLIIFYEKKLEHRIFNIFAAESK